MDIVYKPIETALVRAARLRGARVVHGGRMLLWQAARQFELYTGHEAPAQAMDEGGANRLVPGTGEFPLRDWVAALPEDIVIGVEVPLGRLIGTVPPEARAAMMIGGMRGLYENGTG